LGVLLKIQTDKVNIHTEIAVCEVIPRIGGERDVEEAGQMKLPGEKSQEPLRQQFYDECSNSSAREPADNGVLFSLFRCGGGDNGLFGENGHVDIGVIVSNSRFVVLINTRFSLSLSQGASLACRAACLKQLKPHCCHLLG
jgi:hypothetical protein